VFDYRARLTRPYDGDSFWVELDQGMGSRQEEELRLLGVSAPEKYQPGGLESRDFVVAWFAQVSQTRKWPLYVVTVPNNTIEPTERRTFVRYLATVSDIVDGSRVLNAALATFLSQHPEWGHGI
jgi:endonuclease YncB( thermonuclease family)